MFLSLTLTCASMTNIKAPQPPNIYSESKVWSKKSICPGKSHIWNCINELLLISTNSKQSGLRAAAQHFYQAQTWASMTNIKAPQPPNIQSESKVGSKKSMCPGRSQIENCMNEFDVNSVTKQQTGQVCTSSSKKQRKWLELTFIHNPTSWVAWWNWCFLKQNSLNYLSTELWTTIVINVLIWMVTAQTCNSITTGTEGTVVGNETHNTNCVFTFFYYLWCTVEKECFIWWHFCEDNFLYWGLATPK